MPTLPIRAVQPGRDCDRGWWIGSWKVQDISVSCASCQPLALGGTGSDSRETGVHSPHAWVVLAWTGFCISVSKWNPFIRCSLEREREKQCAKFSPQLSKVLHVCEAVIIWFSGLKSVERVSTLCASEGATLTAEVPGVSILRQSRRLYGCWPLKGA
jgi:hypothetical protein